MVVIQLGRDICEIRYTFWGKRATIPGEKIRKNEEEI